VLGDLIGVHRHLKMEILMKINSKFKFDIKYVVRSKVWLAVMWGLVEIAKLRDDNIVWSD
jgi:hypothetical protein